MAGILDYLGGMGGLLGDQRNALMGLGLGLASGQNWQDGAANALRGFIAGQAGDRSQRGQMAAVEYVLGRPDVDPALKDAIRRNPELAVKFLGEAGKPPKYDFHNWGNNVVRTRPDQPSIEPVARIPEYREVDDGQGGKRGVFITPDPPVPTSVQRSRTDPHSIYQGGFNDRYGAAGDQPRAGQPQPNQVRTVIEPPPPANPDAMPGRATDEQNKAAGFARRMYNAEAVLQNPAVVSAATDIGQKGKAAVPILGNYLVSNEYQKFDQAQRDFINAALRRESGAVINPDEFKNAQIQYLPQPGDGPEKLEQKKANRQATIRGIAGSAGPSFRGHMTFDAEGNIVPVEPSRPVNTPGAPQAKGEQGRAPMNAPPPEAVRLLQQNPQLRDQFEAKYGRGSAARYLQ